MFDRKIRWFDVGVVLELDDELRLKTRRCNEGINDILEFSIIVYDKLNDDLQTLLLFPPYA